MYNSNIVRFAVLDSWRGIAALFVAFGHLKASGFLSSLLISTTSYRFVDFFFVLSGFVIAHSSSQKLATSASEVWRFFIRRIARLWPLHIFLLSLFILHQTVLLLANKSGYLSGYEAFSEGFGFSYLFHNVFLIQAWDLLPEAGWNKPAWSISTEIFAYIVFALFCFFFGKAIWRVIPFMALAIFTYVLLNPDIMQATYSGALVRCMAGFFIGVCVYFAYLRFGRLQLWAPSCIEAAVFFTAFMVIVFLPKDMGALILPVFAITIFVFSYEQGAISSYLKAPIFVYLGERSYSVYLTHAFIVLGIYSFAGVVGWLGNLPDNNTGIVLNYHYGDFMIIGYLLLVVLISHWTYKKIEIPGQAIGRAIIARRSLLFRSS